ncbi:LuxR C-terminal-related transcriptional regulator [Enterobacter roggenkampii]|uniref:LuxR C-terminal-related transcriptional regulator n=1 Tax=Enterobacter roggenkampii TaxID=1812935 RepID=UPI002A82567D|nr:LuxR C-terminal-related transcriptional regulator [Enterobacter roggenkampii]
MIKNINVLVVTDNNFFIEGLSIFLKETFKNVSFYIFHVGEKSFYLNYFSAANFRNAVLHNDFIIMPSLELLTGYEGGMFSSKVKLQQLNEVITEVIEKNNQAREKAMPNFKLSKRELAFFYYLSKGSNDISICNSMNISTKTASTYRRNLINKLGFKKKHQLIKFVSSMIN